MDKIFFSYFNSDDIDNILNSLKDKKEYVCTIPYFDHNSELLISKIISLFLKDIIFDTKPQTLIVIITEILTFINKMNIKKEYFEINNLDINDPIDYLVGLNNFRKSKYYVKHMKDVNNKEKKSYIKISIKVLEESLEVEIKNGFELPKSEYMKIEDSFDYCKKYTNLLNAFTNDPNISESDHFCLILAALTLKNINLECNNIKLESDDGMTLTSISIPFNKIKDIQAHKITTEIIKEIKLIPQFPESILRLQKELMDPEWDYTRISDYILSDPALTAEVLRLVNSPVYRSNEKIDKISIAVKKIGLKGLKSILYNFGTLQVLGSRYKIEKINKYKDHLFQVALISSYLANHKNLNSFAEDIYVAALMHDIGKIITSSINPEFAEKLNDLCHDRMIPTDIIDNLSDGYNHSLIGSELTKKWDFPLKYSNAIKYHHNPDSVIDEYKIITYCVYLGNEISHIIKGKEKFSNLNSSVLSFFDLNSEDQFKSLLKKMKNEGLYL